MDNRKKTFLAGIVVLAAAASVVYCRSLNAPFVFDDSASVINNPSIVRLWPLIGDAQHPGPLNPPPELPTSGRPLVNLSLAMNYWLGEREPAGYRVFNLIVHVLSAVLLMMIVERTLCLDYFEGAFERVGGPLALVVAIVWALHPLQTETVVYVTQRTELLVGFCYLATLYCSLRYWAAASTAAQITWLALAIAACLAGMACKEVMVTAPVVVLLFERTFVSGSFREAWRKSWPLYTSFLLCWGLLIDLNRSAPRSESAGFHLGVSAYAWWFTQAKVLMLYLKLTFWPWPLSIHYDMPYLTTPGEAWPWLLAIVILGTATMLLLWRRRAIGFVGACVLLILSPTLFVPIVTEVAAERRMYLPLAALLTLLIAGGYWLLQQAAERSTTSPVKSNSPKRWPAARTSALGLLLAAVLGVVSFQRLAAYRNDQTLWQDDVEHQPDNPLAHYNLGNAFLRAGRSREAAEQYQQALQLNPHYADAYVNLAAAFSHQGRLPEAVNTFQRLLQFSPGHPEVHCNLGVALAQANQVPAAIAEFQEALRLKPEYFTAYYDLGNTLLAAGRTSEAVAAYRQAVRLNPGDSQAHYNLGNALQQLKQSEDAIAQYQLALKIRPDYTEAHNNLGSALLQAGRTDEAIEQYKLTVEQNPNHANAYANMAIAYAQMRRSREAIEAAQTALELARFQGQTALTEQLENLLTNLRAN